METLEGILIVILILIILVCIFVDIIHCNLTGDFSGITGKTTVIEYLFGGSCRGIELGSTVSSPIKGILSKS
jgi:hypothetical protein